MPACFVVEINKIREVKMYCRKCGTRNEDSSLNCIQCGESLQASAASPTPPVPTVPNYLVQSILATIFCCLPLGIVAIIFAAQVNGKIQAGDMQGALSSSKNAKMFCWIAFGLGLAGTLLYITFIVLSVAIGNQ